MLEYKMNNTIELDLLKKYLSKITSFLNKICLEAKPNL